MRFDPGKTYPHPVLRPGSSDYPDAEFEVEIDLQRFSGGTELRVKAAFALSDPDLLGLVESGKAKYVLHVLASKIHFRTALDSAEPTIEDAFPDGKLHGQVVLSPFLVCTRDVSEFSAAGWHDDYASLQFDMAPGSVLAQDTPKEYWVDTAEEARIGSIFTLVRSVDRGLRAGTWRCQLAGERVEIAMPAGDYDRFCGARERVNNTADAQYVMNGVYLPALAWVLAEADREQESHEGWRWYRALQARLEGAKLPPFGAETADRLMDAQRLLNLPFPKMPLMVAGDGGDDVS